MNISVCESLPPRHKFAEYITFMENDPSLVAECRLRVCGALWGTGNPDISGMGMVTGYILETSIMVIIVSIFLAINNMKTSNQKYTRFVLANVASTFYDTALFFTLAVQLASNIILAKANSGLNTDGMGAITMKITWVISNLTLLPLLPMALGSYLFCERTDAGHELPTLTLPLAPQGRKVSNMVCLGGTSTLLSMCSHQERIQQILDAKNRQRFGLFFLCWCCSFYPFLSRMIANYGQSQIGGDPGSVITQDTWNEIIAPCFEDISSITSITDSAINFLGVISWLFVTVMLVYKVILLGMENTHQEQWMWLKRKNLTLETETMTESRMWMSLCTITIILLASQIWSFFRLRKLQRDMTKNIGGDYTDEQWTFGQIVSVIVFVPVFVETFHLIRYKKIYGPN
ncbi:hypothetical protein B0J11DRAFT_506699 [Dendryphion nanum]|uniref:Uncharacterized protein n=1 Tax=Dendryphion nanum TaxID=256645 RepID=A0A9P9IIR4_9PLEO|nr:hypothetical protein B0J11DRAFT_506699 [Dendryphion nanum]